MKIPLSWIKEYLDISLAPPEIAEKLTSGGIEVEGVEIVNGDSIFEISLTPNLGHCMSIVGIARELAALCNLKIRRKQMKFSENKRVKIEDLIDVDIEDRKMCLRYACRLVQNVKIGPSPRWIQDRLEAAGVRSINNIVDVGNYVMIEFGQPLHMFDFDQLREKKIVVKSNLKGAFIGLDEIQREISEEMVLICDGSHPIAIAGVIGGKGSAISDQTKNILIESAFFTPETVRKTSKKLNLRTESSTRFERGIDFRGVLAALDRAVDLLLQVASGEASFGVIDKKVQEVAPKILDCRISHVNELLGTDFTLREIAQFFQRLEIETVKEKEGLLQVAIPTYRHDLNREIDLIEEIARLYGYQHIPISTPKVITSTLTHSPLYLFEEQVREKLLSQGLQELITCSLISPTLAKLTLEPNLAESNQIHVLHPRSIDQSILRPSLLPGILQVVQYNLDHENEQIAGFEVGKIHFKNGEDFIEQWSGAIVFCGNTRPYHFDPKPSPFDFFDLKGYVETFLIQLGFLKVGFELSHLHNFHPKRQLRVKIKDLFVGALGEIHPAHTKALGINKKIYYAEFNLNDLLFLKKEKFTLMSLPSYPASQRDWTVTIKEEIPCGFILNTTLDLNAKLLEKVELLDLYKSEKIGKDRKNVTLRFTYRDRAKTLSFEEVEKEHAFVINSINAKIGD
ncbi:MAG: phenylalanine--tRNA ligase subunit beta [Chlamydiae bacterium]|nr:phenylalanine--tRNA ligase subunit beta [Chlamydiota bacterium]